MNPFGVEHVSKRYVYTKDPKRKAEVSHEKKRNAITSAAAGGGGGLLGAAAGFKQMDMDAKTGDSHIHPRPAAYKAALKTKMGAAGAGLAAAGVGVSQARYNRNKKKGILVKKNGPSPFGVQH